VRRVLVFVLLGLGVFAVALGLALRLYAYPRLAKAPLEPRSVSVATGSGITALVFAKSGNAIAPEVRHNLNLTANRFVAGDVSQPEVVAGGDVASWIEAVEIVDQNGNRIKATERQLCVDRHTNEAVEPCSKRYVRTNTNPRTFELITEENVPQPGLNFKFPFDTERRSYQLYDLTIRAAAEAKFDGTEEIDGLDVYRFVQDIPPTKIETRPVPGSLVGSTETTVDADMYYQNRRTVWVEPETGQIVKGQEQQRQELVPAGQSQGQGTVVFDGTLTFNDETVTKNVSDAKDNKAKLWLLTGLPIFLWIGGGVLIVAALVLLYLGRGGRGGSQDSPTPPRQRQLTGASS
jgi:Porin PorA